jgi:SAM-dependent methyltransferase
LESSRSLVEHDSCWLNLRMGDEMSDFYTKPFADYYDIRAAALIQNVGQELEFFRFIFDSFAEMPVHNILDAACGTGRHTIPLMQEGYSVTGIDLNQTMLDVCRDKAEAENLSPRIFREDMREIDFADEFDALICMNTAFQYLLTDEDILKTLGAFHRALKPGGLAIIDLMNFMSLLGRYRTTAKF